MVERWHTTMTGQVRNLDMKDTQCNYKNINILDLEGGEMGHDDDGRSLTLEIINNERLQALCHVLHTHPSLAAHKGSGFRVSGLGFTHPS
jgi:hypothetical protein